MTTLSITLPESMKRFVEEQAQKGSFDTPSEYVGTLIREAQARAEREELELELQAGLNSPKSEMTAANWTRLHQQAAGPSGEGEIPSLFGAARPFIRRTPASDEDWDEAIARSIAEEYVGITKYD